MKITTGLTATPRTEKALLTVGQHIVTIGSNVRVEESGSEHASWSDTQHFLTIPVYNEYGYLSVDMFTKSYINSKQQPVAGKGYTFVQHMSMIDGELQPKPKSPKYLAKVIVDKKTGEESYYREVNEAETASKMESKFSHLFTACKFGDAELDMLTKFQDAELITEQLGVWQLLLPGTIIGINVVKNSEGRNEIDCFIPAESVIVKEVVEIEE